MSFISSSSECVKIYDKSEDLVRVLKKTLKPYKNVIKEKTNRGKWFPFISLNRIEKLDSCANYWKSNHYKFNDSIDRKLNKISRKYFPENNKSVEGENGSTEEPPQKKRKIVNSLLDLNLINGQNEDLDFEEENTNPLIEIIDENDSNSTLEPKLTNGNSNKLNGFPHKTDYQRSNGNTYRSDKTEPKSQINGFSANNNNNNNNNNNSGTNVFKIPKKSSQTIETIIENCQRLAQPNVRPVEAYNHLVRYLTEDQWSREDIRELLVKIAKNMVLNKDFGANVSKFNELIDKIKGFNYIDDDFWDEIIYSVEKKKSDSKNNLQINSFLMSLHDFMTENKISARVLCTEAVIIAYRLMTNHPSAKDLNELQL